MLQVQFHIAGQLEDFPAMTMKNSYSILDLASKPQLLSLFANSWKKEQIIFVHY